MGLAITLQDRSASTLDNERSGSGVKRHAHSRDEKRSQAGHGGLRGMSCVAVEAFSERRESASAEFHREAETSQKINLL